jgi:putative FmdB family regulatory protein
MPLYEYVCKACGQEFEKMVRITEADTLPECPTCQSRRTQKRLSTFATRGSSQSGSSTAGASSCNSSGRFT